MTARDTPFRDDSLTDERELVSRLRVRDEAAFMELVDRYNGQLVRLARTFVRDPEVAAEVAQDAWLGALRGLDTFEARSSLKTWLFGITANIARTRARREQRSTPVSALVDGSADESDDLELQFGPEGQWSSVPNDWEAIPERQLLSRETRVVIVAAIASLPDRQREVIELRDIAGWGSDEVCNVLNLTETNQRVLLHRARAKVRRALEAYLLE